MDLKALRRRRDAVGRRPRLRRITERAPTSADRGDRGLRGGRWSRDSAGLRPDRRRAGAKLGIPEVKRSLVAAGGGLLRLPRMLPRTSRTSWRSPAADHRRARPRARAGQPPDRAGTALDGAVALATTIAANGPLALAGSKRILRESPRLACVTGVRRQRAIWEPIFASEDAKEGATALRRSGRLSGEVVAD